MLIYLAMIETEADKSKFETIYTAYKNLMFYVANQILGDTKDAEDVVHQAFIKVIENIEKIDEATCPKTRGFVVTITERKAIDLYRQRHRHTTVSLDTGLGETMEGRGGLEEIPAKLTLAEAMAQLPERYREVLLLKYDAGYKEKEIADLLSMSEENVHKTVQRAKNRLQMIFSEMEGAAE